MNMYDVKMNCCQQSEDICFAASEAVSVGYHAGSLFTVSSALTRAKLGRFALLGVIIGSLSYKREPCHL